MCFSKDSAVGLWAATSNHKWQVHSHRVSSECQFNLDSCCSKCLKCLNCTYWSGYGLLLLSNESAPNNGVMENCGDEDIRTRGTCGDCCTKSWDDEPKMIDRSASPPNLSGDILCVTYSPCCNVIPAILSFSGGRESKKKKLAGFRRHFHLHEEAAIEPTRGHIRQIYYWRGQSMDCGWSVDDNTFVVTVQLQLSQWSAKCILLYMY